MGSEMGSNCVWKTTLPLICSSGTEQLALCALKTNQKGKMKKAFQALSPTEAGSLETPEREEPLSERWVTAAWHDGKVSAGAGKKASGALPH